MQDAASGLWYEFTKHKIFYVSQNISRNFVFPIVQLLGWETSFEHFYGSQGF